MLINWKTGMAYWLPGMEKLDEQPVGHEMQSSSRLRWLSSGVHFSNWENYAHRWPATAQDKAQAWMEMHGIEELPKGYEVCGFGIKSKGATPRVNIQGEATASLAKCYSYPVQLRKAHKEPELVWLMWTQSTWISREVPDEITSIDPIGEYKINHRGQKYDMLLVKSSSLEDEVWLGHWNDGPK